MAMGIEKKKARIFILGISGFIGYNLAHYFRRNYSVTGAYFSTPISIPDVHTFQLDLKKKDYLDRLIRMLRPHFTIMAAGINDPQKCSEMPKLAEAINSVMPLELAQSAIQQGAKNIYLSCSQVFDGTSSNSKETDKNYSSLNFGRTKLTGESYIRAQTMENTTIRFGKVVGLSHIYRPSYFDKLRGAMARGKIHYIREEKTYSFISMQKLARSIQQILESDIPAVQRLFHISGVPMKELAMNKILAELIGADPELVQQKKHTSEDEFEGRVDPNRDYTLNSELFQKTYKWKPESIDEFKIAIQNQLVPTKSFAELVQTLG